MPGAVQPYPAAVVLPVPEAAGGAFDLLDQPVGAFGAGVGSQLDAAVRERDAVKATFDLADARLRQAIVDADAVGVPHTEIAERTGFHRNSVRRIVEDHDQRSP